MALGALLALGAACADPRPPRTWTVAVYMAGDNALSGAAELDLDEIRRAAASPYLTVLVQQDVAGRTARRYRVSGGVTEQVADLGELDTSAPETLTDFVAWATSAERSERTVLILWSDAKGWDLLDGPSALGAGGGPVSGRSMFPDFDNGTQAPFLQNHRIRQAIEAAGVHLDLLGFDACLMASLEALYEFRGLADYLVASEELEPTRGWDYTALLSALAEDPAMTPRHLARAAVRTYRAFYEDVFFPSVPSFERYPTLVAFRADALDAVALAVDARAAELRGGLADPARRSDVVAALAAARAAAQPIDLWVKPHVYVDLADLEARLGGGTAIAEALAGATVAEYHGAARPGARGASIVFFDRPTADVWGTYDPSYRNHDPAGGAGNAAAFVNRFQWDELLAEYYAAAGL